MSETRWKCRKCGTVYFQRLESCDWCPDVVPVEVSAEPKQWSDLQRINQRMRLVMRKQHAKTKSS